MTAALKLIEGGRATVVQPHDPNHRGYVIRYEGSHTPCPGCHKRNWIVGRLLAECAFCATAVAI